MPQENAGSSGSPPTSEAKAALSGGDDMAGEGDGGPASTGSVKEVGEGEEA